MRSPIAYAPRPGPLSRASAVAATLYLGSFAAIAFTRSSPVVLLGALAAVCVAGIAAGGGRALGLALRWGFALGLFVIAINGIASQRGDTILVRGGEVPVLGRIDVSGEALAEGGVLALRIVVVLAAFAVHSACVDPDRVLRLVRPLARHSALTATLITRMVPLAAADHARLREAASLRGPAAAPVGRAAMVRRLVAGSLDRAVDIAATLELRGYGHGAPRSAVRPRPGRHSRLFALAGVGVVALAIAAVLAGVAGFDAYPTVSIETDAATVALAAAPAADRRRAVPGRRDRAAEEAPWLSRSSASPASATPIPVARRRCAASTSSSSEGELVVLAGRSGAGKTTLLRAACGLVPHYHGGEVSGELRVAGLDVREHGPADLGGAVGLVAQDPETQIVSATVRGELELPLDLRGEPPAARARAVEEAALALGIAALLDRTSDTLSGGELQRVALAAALVLRPRLVLLDEPTSQLDPVAGDELIGLLRRLNEEWGMAVVLSEHRLERCLAAADRVVALAGGALAFDGSPAEFAAWARDADPSLATPAARLFSLAGLEPLPVGAKDARAALSRAGIEVQRTTAPAEPEPSRRARRGRSKQQFALVAGDLWVELDAGAGPREVLRGLDLTVAAGERVALMGRNGAGKTTLMRAAAGLIEPARGVVETPRGCALLPQSAGDLFVRERVDEELPGEEGRLALARVGLEWAAGSDPRDLSGGERERLALAIVAAGRAADGVGLVCLDEPTRGMDGARKGELNEWTAELAAAGAAVLVTTHDVEFASRFADRVLLLGEGELIADGEADEILSGGWYFATEVARILGGGGAITPEAGAALIGGVARPRCPGEGG